MRRMALLIFVMGLFSTTSFAQTYHVTGLSDKDGLEVRADVDKVLKRSEAKVVGSIPHNGKDITTTGIIARLDDGSRWREIVFKDVRGWVDVKFLEEVTGEGLPEDLNCSGTEPFWELAIRGDKAVLKDFAAGRSVAPYEVADKRYGLNRSGLWSYHFRAEDKKAELTAVVKHTDQCSLGMGELEYAVEIYLLGFKPEEGPAQGCCSFNR